MRNFSTVPIFIFGVLWALMVGAIDYLTVRDTISQWRSLEFSQTEGEIKKSEVVARRGRKGTSYHVELVYSFTVGNREYEGTRFRYGSWGSTGAKAANSIAKEHPVGSKTVVYYNRADPSDAVLYRGIDGGTAFPFIFVTPFNIIALLFISLPLSAFVRWIRKAEAGGIRIFREGSKTRARLTTIPAFVAGLGALGAACFISVFVVGFGLGFSNSFASVIAIGIIDVVAGIGVYLWRLNKIRSGKEDLVIDGSTMTVSLPQIHGRKRPEEIVIKEIASVSVF